MAALAMLPVILWQGWETLGDAREEGSEAVAEDEAEGAGAKVSP